MVVNKKDADESNALTGQNIHSVPYHHHQSLSVNILYITALMCLLPYKNLFC